VVKAMSVGTESTKGVKEGEPKFLGAREQKYTKPFATGEGNNVACHSFTGLSKKGGNFCRKVNGGGSPNADSPYRIGNGAICGKSLGVGASDMYNIGESSVWEKLVDEVRVSGEEMMDVERRDCMRLRFNELVHMVPTGKC